MVSVLKLIAKRSIIIGNFSSRTGSALVTQAQREWIDLEKLIKRLKPSKRPKIRPSSPIRAWCYDRAIHKHGVWSRMMTILFVVQIIVLMFVLSLPSIYLLANINDSPIGPKRFQQKPLMIGVVSQPVDSVSLALLNGCI